MRILVVTALSYVHGGAETYARELVPRLVARGHAVASAFEVDAPQADPIDRTPSVPRFHLEDPRALAAIDAWKPDVAYVQGLHDPAVEAAILARVPSVLFMHNYHATCISGSKARHLPTLRPCDRVFGPACLALYLPCRCGGRNPVEMAREYRVRRRRQRLLGRYRFVLVATHHMERELARNGVAASRLRVLRLFPVAGPSSPDAPDAPDARAPRPERRADRLLFFGRITRLKGGDLLVDATALASKALGRRLSLVVAGDGPARAALERQAGRLGVPIELTGWVGSAARDALLERTDLLAVPSAWPEPFGLAGIEAGARGVPSVAFAVGGVPEWLRAGVSGELAPGDPPTAAGLADAIVRALRDPDHLARLSAGALAVAREFAPEAHVRGLEAILAEAAASR